MHDPTDALIPAPRLLLDPILEFLTGKYWAMSPR
jgi:hypothetical protein